MTVLVQHLDPATDQPIAPGGYTFQSFDAFTGALRSETVQAPEGFTAQVAKDSLATYVRARGPADLNASGAVTPADLSILANNFGATVDPFTGELLANDPSLAAAPTGDTNGDGVVDISDLNMVISNMGQGTGGGGNFEIEDDPLTESEAAAVEAAFSQAAPQILECIHCFFCHLGWCQVLVPLDPDDSDPPAYDDGDPVVPEDGGHGPGGHNGPGNGPDGGPNGDENGDGIPNKDDCVSPRYTGNPAACDSDGDGTPDGADCGSCKYLGNASECPCADVDITFSPECTARMPNYVWILPEDQLPKRVTIRACGGPPGGVHQWLFTDSEVAVLDPPNQKKDEAILSVKLLKGGNFAATVLYTAWINGQPCPLTSKVFDGAVVNKVSLESVAFTGSGIHDLRDDFGVAFPTKQWLDQNLDGDTNDEGDVNAPLAYTRDATMQVGQVVYRIEPAGVDLGDVELDGEVLDFFHVKMQGFTVDSRIVFPSAQSDINIPNTVDARSDLVGTWKLRFGCDDAPRIITLTAPHTMYVTLGAPSIPNEDDELESYCNISCRAGKGAMDEVQLFERIYARFQAGSVRNMAGLTLGYYRGTGPCPLNCNVSEAPLLLQTGNGQCNAWARLLQRCAQVHGITTTQRVTLSPGANLPLSCIGMRPERFLIKNYSLVESPLGTGCDQYPHRFNAPCGGEGTPWAQTDVTDDAGTPGQAEVDPASAFRTHFIVQFNGKYYDPSYGTPPFNSVRAWEEACVFGYAATISDGSVRLGVRLNDPATQEIHDATEE